MAVAEMATRRILLCKQRNTSNLRNESAYIHSGSSQAAVKTTSFPCLSLLYVMDETNIFYSLAEAELKKKNPFIPISFYSLAKRSLRWYVWL